MTKPEHYYNEPPMALSLEQVKKYAESDEFGCKYMSLVEIPLSNIVLDVFFELQIFLLANLIEDPMELNDKMDFLKKKGEPKGVHLQKLIQVINRCGITFSVWEKRNDEGKCSGTKDWTSLMGDEKKKLL